MTNSEQPPMADIQRWIDFHRADLHELADHLQDLVPSIDGQHSPVAGASQLLHEVRQLVEAP